MTKPIDPAPESQKVGTSTVMGAYRFGLGLPKRYGTVRT
jgi:hypothetical protein